MEFHPEKCQLLQVTNKRNVIQDDYTIHGHTLNTTDTTKYLGMEMHNKLSWQKHIPSTVCKAEMPHVHSSKENCENAQETLGPNATPHLLDLSWSIPALFGTLAHTHKDIDCLEKT